MDEPQVVKIIVVGESNAGKTSLLQQYCFKEFNQNHLAIIGCDFTLTLNGTKFKLQIWDVAGKILEFIKKVYGCLIMCDIKEQQIRKEYNQKGFINQNESSFIIKNECNDRNKTKKKECC